MGKTKSRSLTLPAQFQGCRMRECDLAFPVEDTSMHTVCGVPGALLATDIDDLPCVIGVMSAHVCNC